MVINTSHVDPKFNYKDDVKAKKDFDEAPVTVEKDKEEAENTESSFLSSSNESKNDARLEPEQVGGPEVKEPTSSSEETSKTEEASSPTNEEFGRSNEYEADVTDVQDDEYPWQVACCGIDVPMGK